MPGPLLAFTVGAAARHGFWVGPLIIVGHAILELALLIALVLGLNRFFENDTFASVVGVIGGTVLIVMGVAIVGQGRRKESLTLSPSPVSFRNRRMVFAGILVSMSNPYWFIWWATIGLTYLLWSLELGAPGVASFFSGHILADLAWYAFVAFLVAGGRKAMNVPAYSWLLIACGVGLVGLGGYFLASGVRFLAE